jgi:hypothetical protein
VARSQIAQVEVLHLVVVAQQVARLLIAQVEHLVTVAQQVVCSQIAQVQISHLVVAVA